MTEGIGAGAFFAMKLYRTARKWPRHASLRFQLKGGEQFRERNIHGVAIFALGEIKLSALDQKLGQFHEATFNLHLVLTMYPLPACWRARQGMAPAAVQVAPAIGVYAEPARFGHATQSRRGRVLRDSTESPCQPSD